MAHIEASIEINPLSQELISDYLISELGFGGIVLEEKIYEKTTAADSLPNANEAYFDEKSSTHIIKAYAQELLMSEEKIQKSLHNKKMELIGCGIAEENLGTWNATFLKVEDESWATNWMQHWDVQKIGNKTVICPSWLEYASQEGEIVLELDPGAAFGTGTHPTTRLCIRELEGMVASNCTIADVGCGSGILSIAAKKYGAGEIVGVDVDETSIEVAEDNAKKNNVVCEFYQGSADAVKGQYDIVVANILAHIIIDIMSDLVPLMKNEGKMLLSGIIEEQKNKMLETLSSQGLEVVQVAQEEEWLCMVAKKRSFC